MRMPCTFKGRIFPTHMMENPADFYYGVIWNKLTAVKLLKSAIFYERTD